MTVEAAKLFLNNPFFNTSNPQHWADLGCGTGLFTRVLWQLLPKGSEIYALDRDQFRFAEPGIHFIQQDFVQTPLHFPVPLNGILMANSLHFVKDKLDFLSQVHTQLLPGGALLLVEYDLNKANPWVPFPLSYQAVLALFAQMGFDFQGRLHEQASLYNRANIYSALFLKAL